MAQLAVAWVLQNDNVSSAIVGASRPEQVVENVKAAGVRIPAELMSRIDEALGDIGRARPGPDRGQRPVVASGRSRTALSRGGGGRP